MNILQLLAEGEIDHLIGIVQHLFPLCEIALVTWWRKENEALIQTVSSTLGLHLYLNICDEKMFMMV